MKEAMPDYIDSNGLYHFVRDDDMPIVTPDKEYIEHDKECLKRALNSTYGLKDSADAFRYVNYSDISSARARREFALSGADFDGDIVGIYGIKEEKEMNTKRITLIGSVHSDVNKAAMLSLYNRLTYKGIIVYIPYMGEIPEDVSDEQIELLHDLHEEKMIKSDMIIVVDADGHVGKDTQREINWCIDHGKNLIYLSDMQVYDGEEKQTKGGKK